MPITKNAERQYVMVARADFTHVDLDTDDAVQTNKIVAAVDVPAGAIVVGGELVISVAFANGAGTAVIDIGDGGDPDRYTASAINVKTATRTAITPSGYVYTAADTIDFDVTTATAVTTAGTGYVLIHYIVEDRANENYR